MWCEEGMAWNMNVLQLSQLAYIYVASCVEQRCACFSIVGCLVEQEAVWCLGYGLDSTLLPERSMCYS